jgi:hypothetical protein
MSDLNNKNFDMVNDYLSRPVSSNCYMLTIARDGEEPVRSIYNFKDAITASEAYNRYTDWGFAKEYLTVKLYEPTGIIHEKVLRRPPAGECVFVRDSYIKASNLLLSIKDKITKDGYIQLVEEFAIMFSQDNVRFDVERFFKDTQYKEMKE